MAHSLLYPQQLGQGWHIGGAQQIFLSKWMHGKMNERMDGRSSETLCILSEVVRQNQLKPVSPTRV